MTYVWKGEIPIHTNNLINANFSFTSTCLTANIDFFCESPGFTEVKPIFHRYYATSLPFKTVYFFPFTVLLGVGFLLKYSTAFHCWIFPRPWTVYSLAVFLQIVTEGRLLSASRARGQPEFCDLLHSYFFHVLPQGQMDL